MSGARDRFDTPRHLAELIADSVSLKRVGTIADFAAGGGELLGPAAQAWPGAQVVAADVCGQTVRKLRVAQPGWVVRQVDFLSIKARNKCAAMRALLGSVDVVLLNPPFSCRGGALRDVSVNGVGLRCSEAMAFVVTALEYLSASGELIAIMPSGAMTSEKDHPAWTSLRSVGAIDVLGTNGRTTFRGCSAKTTIVRFRPRTRRGGGSAHIARGRRVCPVRGDQPKVIIKRGSVQMHAIPVDSRAARVPLIHSTGLRLNEAHSTQHVRTSRSILNGPAVLVPRVGAPTADKLVMVSGQRAVALSDCVIGIRCRNRKEMVSVNNCLRHNWDALANLYGGTCAPYLTVARLARFLSTCGIHVMGDY